MRYFRHVLIAITQLLNTLTGGFPDESTSSRAYRQRHKRHWRIIHRLIDRMFFWQEDHCMMAYVAEVQRRQTHPNMR